MTEKINMALLFAIFIGVVCLLIELPNRAGRFQPMTGSAEFVALDTKTGQACLPFASANGAKALPPCKELAKQ